MSKNLRELQARRASTLKAMRAIVDTASAESRDLTPEETELFNTKKTEVGKIDEAIAREQSLVEAERSSGLAATVRTEGHQLSDDDPRHGFASFGEFAAAVRGARGSNIDERLGVNAAAPSTYGNEGAGADGGFLVPPEFSQQIFQLMLDDDAILNYTDDTDVTGNSMVFPKDETTPWGTDGVRAYWQAEAAAGTPTKPKLGAQIMRLHKLLALVPISDELLADTNALGSYLPGLMARSINWKLGEALFNGTGVGQPLGAFTSAAAVTVAKDSGQQANTLSTLNCANMIARLPPGAYKNARWYITPDALPSLFTLTLGNYPIYLPISAGAQGSPYGTLLGRPIEVSQHAAAFSSAGDVNLIAWDWYRTITKAGGVETATSMHLYFDADATAFRALFRIDGQPKIAAAIAQAKGANTLSPYVKLGAR